VGQEEVEGQNLLAVQSGFQAVSVQVDATKQVSGLITVNNRVNVYVSLSTAGGPLSRLLLANVKVLAVGTTTQAAQPGQPANRNGNLSTLTFEVADRHVTKVVYAAENGQLYLTLVPPGPSTTPPVGERTIGNLFD
jgi:Flp pilus assembly protein CpaB